MENAERTISYLAPGTAFEGSIRVDGNMEIDGESAGEIVASGDLTIRSTHKGNCAAGTLSLLRGKIEGNVVVSGTLAIDEGSQLRGDGKIGVLSCEGSIEGNMLVDSDVSLGKDARVKGDITAAFLSVEQGAKVMGRIEVSRQEEPSR